MKTAEAAEPRKGNVWYSDGKAYVQRCPDCGRENWGPAVATGECAWCGWSAPKKQEEGK